MELDPPDNIAVAKIEVASASTRVVQATIFPPLGISFEVGMAHARSCSIALLCES